MTKLLQYRRRRIVGGDNNSWSDLEVSPETRVYYGYTILINTLNNVNDKYLRTWNKPAEQNRGQHGWRAFRWLPPFAVLYGFILICFALELYWLWGQTMCKRYGVPDYQLSILNLNASSSLCYKYLLTQPGASAGARRPRPPARGPHVYQLSRQLFFATCPCHDCYFTYCTFWRYTN